MITKYNKYYFVLYTLKNDIYIIFKTLYIYDQDYNKYHESYNFLYKRMSLNKIIDISKENNYLIVYNRNKVITYNTINIVEPYKNLKINPNSDSDIQKLLLDLTLEKLGDILII